jgi:hypothetical protein
MGHSTTYLGRLDVTPPLNASEIDWLRAYAAADRRCYSDTYDVAMNPRAHAREVYAAAEASPQRSSFTELLSRGQEAPGARCDWVPCGEGCCLSWQRTEKSNIGEQWLRFIVDHFLRPNAHASSSMNADFEAFTFDHVASGTIAAERDDSRELYLIRAEDNAIWTETLVRGDLMPWERERT